MSDDDTVRPSVSLPAALNAAIEAELEYGESKSTWIREACEMRLDGAFEDERRCIDADD